MPYRGGGPQLVDLPGGHVQGGLLALPIAAPYLKCGRLRAIAVTSAKRSAAIPDVPTLDESGLRGLDVSQWWGVLVSANTPHNNVVKLSADLTEIGRLANVRASLAELAAVPVFDTPDQFGTFIHTEIAKCRQVVKQAGITLE